MSRILITTASWADNNLVDPGPSYPSPIKTAASDSSTMPNNFRQCDLWECFRSALQAFRAVGKLGVALIQFPSWIVVQKELIDRYPGITIRYTGIKLD